MTSLPDRYSGFSLIEVTLALGVAVISLLAIFALLPVGLQTSQNANQQTISSDIISAVVSDLRATPPTIPRGSAATSTQFGINIPANPNGASVASTVYFDSTGRSTPAIDANSRYRLTITFLPNAGIRSATLVDLKTTWPAVANPVDAGGSNEIFVALDRN